MEIKFDEDGDQIFNFKAIMDPKIDSGGVVYIEKNQPNLDIVAKELYKFLKPL